MTNDMKFHDLMNAFKSFNEVVHHSKKVHNGILMSLVKKIQHRKVIKEHFSVNYKGYYHPWKLYGSAYGTILYGKASQKRICT